MGDEHPVAVAKASVMLYDEADKKWVAAGQDGTQGMSKVQIFQHVEQNTFRIVGRKINDHDVVINCAITGVLKYHQATPTFHQWRDQKQVYGLNFTCSEDADNFASVLKQAMEIVSGLAQQNGHHRPSLPAAQSPASSSSASLQHQQQQQIYAQQPQQQQQQQQQPQANGGGGYSRNMSNGQQHQQPQPPHQLQSEYASCNDDLQIQQAQQQHHLHANPQDGMTNGQGRKSAASVGQQQQHQRRASQGSSGGSSTHSGGSSLIYAQQQHLNNTNGNIPAAPSPGRIGTIPAPPAPPPPPMPGSGTTMARAGTSGGTAPPPPPPGPPPPPSALRMDSNDLASALQSAKLRKTSQPAENGTRPSGNNHMSELLATIARRKAKAEGAPTAEPNNNTTTTSSEKSGETVHSTPHATRNTNAKPWSGATPDSPRTLNKSNNNIRRMPSGSSLSSTEDQQNTLSVATPNGPPTRAVNGTTAASTVVTQELLNEWRHELMVDVRREIDTAKKEIIDAVRQELAALRH